MKTHKHALLAAGTALIGATVPDVFLAFFAWRKDWVKEDNVFLRLHRFNHSKRGLVFWFFFGVISHIVTDFFCEHNTEETWNIKTNRWQTRQKSEKSV